MSEQDLQQAPVVTEPLTCNVTGCALVFEGGGYRGAYTAGMVNLLLEREIHFDYACGLSAGASHTVDYVSRDQLRSWLAFAGREGTEPPGGLGCLLRGKGYFNADYLYEGCVRDGFCPFDWDTFCANPARIRIQAFAAASGETVTFTKDDMDDVWRLINLVRASSTVPLAMKPLPVDGVTYFDGGLGEGAGIPIRLAELDGYERFVMLATRTASYRKRQLSPTARFVLGRLLKDQPKVYEAFLTRADRYNAELDRIAELEREGRALIIRPDEMPVSNTTLEPKRLEEAYRMGYLQLARDLDRLREFVGL